MQPHEHLAGIYGKTARSHLPHFLLDHGAFLRRNGDTQHNVPLSYRHTSTFLSVCSITVWDYPNKQKCEAQQRGIFGSVATLPMLAMVSLFLPLLR